MFNTCSLPYMWLYTQLTIRAGQSFSSGAWKDINASRCFQ